jgi:hypothetical protein
MAITKTPHPNDLVTLQQAMVKRLKKRLKRFIDQTPELEQYYEEYRGELKPFTVLSYPEELIQRMSESQVVYVGDFHTLLQSQKLIVRFLEQLSNRPDLLARPIILMMEAFHHAHQHHLDAWFDGSIDFSTLLEHARYRQTWGFPVTGYQLILETCRQLGIRVMGINSSPRKTSAPLARRDINAARTIVNTLDLYEDALLLVMIGDLHVASCHLPAKVLQRLDRQHKNVRDLIVYTNSESVYWQLTGMNLEYIVNIVKWNNRQFCVMNSTPVHKYDSYLRFVDGVMEVESQPTFSVPAMTDFNEQVTELARQIGHFLSLGQIQLPDFELAAWYEPDETVADLAARYDANPDDVPGLAACLRARISFFIGPYGLFLHHFSLNDAADAAARLLLRSNGWEPKVKRSRKAFFHNIIYEALIYFAVKVINPKRTCKRQQDFHHWTTREHVNKPSRSPAVRHKGVVVQMVVPHLAAIWKHIDEKPQVFTPDPRWWRARLSRQLEAELLLGHRLGERLFYSAQIGLPSKRIRQGRTRRLTREQVTDLLRHPPRASADSLPLYLNLWEATADVMEHHRTRTDWL